MKVYSISLSTKQTKAHLKAIPNWSQKVQAIYRTFNFNGFMNGIIFGRSVSQEVPSKTQSPSAHSYLF